MVREEDDWTEIHVKKKTRKKLNILRLKNECKTVDELIVKFLLRER